jgi:hypothetical protein
MSEPKEETNGKDQDEKEKAKVAFEGEMAVINSTGYHEVFMKKGE